MNTRTHQQNLNLLREMNRIIRTHLEAFAYAAAVTVNRGRLYRFAQEIGVSPLEITTELGRDVQHLNRVGDLADTYGQPATIEFRHAAWLAFSCYGLRMGAVVAAIESAETMAKTLGPTGRFARAVLEWRRLTAAGELPPAEAVACQIGHFFGVEVDEYSVADIVRDLVDALPTQSVSTEQLLAIVAQYRGAVMSPELVSVIAADVVKLAGTSTAARLVRSRCSATNDVSRIVPGGDAPE